MFALLVAFLAGCDADCEDASRINGEYAMWHSVLNANQEGGATMDEAYPSYEVFINGWSRWNLTWSASGGTVSAEITDVPELQSGGEGASSTPETFSGTLTSADDNCNVFNLDLSGDFTTASGSTHAFTYTAEMVFYGDNMSGTFAYDDTWSKPGEDGAAPTSGQLAGASGDLQAVRQTDGTFDTGFGEE